MIKRISILVRRPQDEREAFSRHWCGVHGPLVARLPDIGRYVQNHVVEEFSTGLSGPEGYDIDGFVELYFADDAARRRAFSGPLAEPIWADEVNFLGHSTAYVIDCDRHPSASMTEAKLVIVATGSPAGLEWLEPKLRVLAGLQAMERNDVVEAVARTTMARGPQPADVFFHLRFADVGAAREAGGRLTSSSLAQAEANGIRQLAITRVTERRIV